jgi:hypothetical protein
MKPHRKTLLASLLLAGGLQFGLSSCATDGYVGTGVYYGPQRDPWFRDDAWVDGHRWYGGPPVQPEIGVYIYPPLQRR